MNKFNIEYVVRYQYFANWKIDDDILCCKITHNEIMSNHPSLNDHEVGAIVGEIRRLNIDQV